MASLLDGDPVVVATRLALVGALVLAAVVLRRLGLLDGLQERLQARFVAGVPWGTVATVAILLGVYYLVQGALWHPAEPLVVAFRSWTYTNPVGMLVAPFGHGSQGHLVGNLLGTVVVGPIAEYAWGHRARDGGPLPLGDRLQRPRTRIAAFVGGVLVVGWATALFVPGPLIGFSGVVYALGGVGLVTFPVATLVGVVATDVLSLLYTSLQSPVLTETSREIFYTPWWVDVAVHAHALGLLLGIGAGLFVVRRSSRRPNLGALWLVLVVYGFEQGLHLLYWPGAPGEYVLLRGLGLAAVVFVATLVPVVLTERSRPLLPSVGPLESTPLSRLTGVSRRRVAIAILVLPLVGLVVTAVPYNAVAITEEGLEDGIEVRDYRVTYAENVPQGTVAALDLPFVGEAVQVERSGVIVTSPSRGVWDEVVSSGSLAFQGRAEVVVGGLGWRETVVANRTGWTVVDGGDTYVVTLAGAGEPRRRVFADEPVAVPGRFDGANVTIRPTADGFAVTVQRGNATVGAAPIPTNGSTETVDSLTFVREERDLYVTYDGTRVRIAEFELQGRD